MYNIHGGYGDVPRSRQKKRPSGQAAFSAEEGALPAGPFACQHSPMTPRRVPPASLHPPEVLAVLRAAGADLETQDRHCRCRPLHLMAAEGCTVSIGRDECAFNTASQKTFLPCMDSSHQIQDLRVWR